MYQHRLKRKQDALASCWELVCFSRVTRSDPGFKAAFDGIDPGIPLADERARRTGGAVFGWSGTVEDDPAVFWQFIQAGFDIREGDIDRAFHVLTAIGSSIPDINE